jgi:hypothetical protein
MDHPFCDTCPYWDLADPRAEYDPERIDWTIEARIADGELVDGECRRYPRFYPQHKGQKESTTSWPRTSSADWCGEHPDFPAYLATLRAAPAKPNENWHTYEDELDVRSRTVLRTLGIQRMATIAKLTHREMRAVRNCGETTIHIIGAFLASHGHKTTWY